MFGQTNELLIEVLCWACSRVTVPFDANDILFEPNEIWAYMGPEMEETLDEQLGRRPTDKFKPIEFAYRVWMKAF